MYKKILVPIDGSDCSLRGRDEAIELAKELKASLRFVHAVSESFIDSDYRVSTSVEAVIESLREGGKSLLKSAASKSRERGIEAETVLLDQIDARVSDLIVEEAEQWKADLIVMGTHGRRGLARLAVGSDAEMVLSSTSLPVLLVRAAPNK